MYVWKGGHSDKTMKRLFFFLTLFHFCVFVVRWRTYTKTLLSCRRNVHIFRIYIYVYIEACTSVNTLNTFRAGCPRLKQIRHKCTQNMCMFGTMIKFWAIKFAPFFSLFVWQWSEREAKHNTELRRLTATTRKLWCAHTLFHCVQ